MWGRVLYALVAFWVQVHQAHAATQVFPTADHSREVAIAAFSADGRLFATADWNVIKLRETESGRLIRSFFATTDKGILKQIAFSDDGTKIIAASDSVVTVWDIKTGKPTAISSLNQQFSDGLAIVKRQFVVYCDRGFAVLDPNSGKIVNRFGNAQDCRSVDIAGSFTESLIAVGYLDGSISIWDVISGSKVSIVEKHPDQIQALQFSAEGRSLVSASEDGTIRLSDVMTGRKTAEVYAARGEIVHPLLISLDKSIVATNRRNWSFTTGSSVAKTPGKALALSPVSNVAVFQGASRPRAYLGDFTTGSKKEYLLLGQAGAVKAVQAFSEARLVAAAVDRQPIRIWDLESGHLFRSVGDLSGDKLAISNDGRKILGASEYFSEDNFYVFNRAKLWDVETQREVKSFLGIGIAKEERALEGVFFSDGDRTAVIYRDEEFQAFDLEKGRLGRRLKVGGDEAATISKDGSIALVSSETNLSVWNFQAGKRLRSIKKDPKDRISALALSPDGKIGITGADGWLKVYNTQQGQLIQSRRLDDDQPRAIAISPGADYVASANLRGKILTWSVAGLSSSSSLELIGHEGAVQAVTYSSDTKRIVSGGDDGTLRVWESQTGKLLCTLVSFSSNDWIAITPEGFFTSSSNGAKFITVVDELTVLTVDQFYNSLFRPDLVREKLAGDPKGIVREAAAKLDLNKVMASGGAPKVSIVTSAGNVANDEATVEVTIAEQNGGGIGKIEWRVNGVTLGIESRGLERLPEGTASSPVSSRPAVTLKRTLALEPGENRIEIVAYNGRDLIASDPAQVTLKWNGDKSTTSPKLHVLAVGVNDYYDSRLRLSYAVPDAKALGDAMKQAGGSLYQSVEITSVLDDKVTTDNLDQVFTELGKKVHPRDVFVFFLAGHGKTVDGRYHFLPQNFRYEDETSIVRRGINQEQFQTWFAKIRARKSILLYDTCESGSLTGDRVQQRGIERVAALEKMTRAMGRTVLSASTDDAPALEGYRGHGVFTYALLDGMAGADTNGNGLIEVTELAAFIDRQVPDLSFQAFKIRQIPQMKIVGNSFPVVSKTTVLQSAETQAVAATTLATIPIKPTHVVVSQSPVDVFIAAARSGAVVQKLPPGTLVTLVDTANGWQLIAKDGQKLGFVEEEALARIQ